MKQNLIATGMATLALALVTPLAMGEVSVEEYPAMLADKDANPGFLVIDQGEILFKEKRGPKNISLGKCDFGLGAGKLKGAYAQQKWLRLPEHLFLL